MARLTGRSVTAAMLLLSSAACVAVSMHCPARVRADGKRAASSSQAAQASAGVAARLGRAARGPRGERLASFTDEDLGELMIGLALTLLSVAVVGPLAGAGAVFVLVRFVRRPARRQAAQRRAVIHELPPAVDLLVVAMRSGHTVSTALTEVAARLDGQIGAALRACLDRVAVGRTLADELQRLPESLGPSVRPLVAALVATERWGVAIAPALTQVAGEARLRRRRDAELAARRLPVTMLFPLVLCVLPAFGLLTVVPVLIDSLQALRL